MKYLAFIFFLYLQKPFTVQSPDFAYDHYMQFRFTCDGQNISPGLVLENIPRGTQSLALLMEDIDSPHGEFVHWVMWNMPVKTRIPENTAPGIQGKNSHGKNCYFGPCQPNGIHTYYIRLFALNSLLNIPGNSGKAELLKAMEGHIISLTSFRARYQRQ
jgi:Raf kinase inhibitor-like YbhB/YbcL family protein